MGFFDSILGRKPSPDQALAETMGKLGVEVFPEGPVDIERHAVAVRPILGNKLSLEECKAFVSWGMVRVHIAQDKRPEVLVPSLQRRLGDRFSMAEAQAAFVYFSGGSQHQGGDGSSAKAAVVIAQTSSLKGISAEYAYLERRFGRMKVDWEIEMRMQRQDEGRIFEVFNLTLKRGGTAVVWFDITSFFGKP